MKKAPDGRVQTTPSSDQGDPGFGPRQGLLLLGLLLFLAAVLVGPVLYLSSRDSGETSPTRNASPEEALADVQDYPDLSRNHVLGKVDYPQNPPVGGDHAGVWVNCGSYPVPVPAELAVHSLEHGAVWLAYRPDVSSEDVKTLETIAEDNDYVLVSPVEGLTSPVVATAWGKQLELSEVSDSRLAPFVTAFANGPQTPEPGAPCAGGVGEG